MADDTLSPESIAKCLETRVLGRRVLHHERVQSTNDIAKELGDAGEPEGALVIAEEQTAGRGRLGRHWTASPRSSILMSLLLRPTLAVANVPRIGMAVALGACDGILAEAHVEARCKWPNDILIAGRKCGGILAETNITGDAVDYVVVGLGLNVNLEESSQGLPHDAIALSTVLGHPLSRTPLVCALLTHIERWYDRLQAGESLHREFRMRLVTIGQTVRAHAPWGEAVGTAEDVDEDGALIMRRVDGTLLRLNAGDVTLASSA
jgi:BirA family biotin operon repressor/biotin-[acetyl-CoA-carboxylase] ligase